MQLRTLKIIFVIYMLFSTAAIVAVSAYCYNYRAEAKARKVRLKQRIDYHIRQASCERKITKDIEAEILDNIIDSL